MTNQAKPVVLRRALSLPLLVFYGLGVTVGAGIFALIGEIVRSAGDGATAAFVIAGVIAGVTGVSYAFLSAEYPRAGGEAVYVNMSLGSGYARYVGYGVTVTAVISSAVIALSFSGYLSTLIPVPRPLLIIGLVSLLGWISWLGVRETVMFAALITTLEVGTLAVIALSGYEVLSDISTYRKALQPVLSIPNWSIILSATVIAFFAFIGFEDLVNMAEETVNPRRNMPLSVYITLGVTVLLYVLISLIAISLPDRTALTQSDAPLSLLFHSVTGMPAEPISVIASVAMVNGVLVQIVMASRVLYGLTRENLAPGALGVLDSKRQTPYRAIILVCVLIAVLALSLPLQKLALATSLVTLSVFFMVNLSLWKMSRENMVLYRKRYWGLLGAVLCGSLLVAELFRLLFARGG